MRPPPNHAALTTAFVGVRNGASTAQGVVDLINLGVTVFAVDTAGSAHIFHPKIYGAIGDKRALLMIGSANLTHPGLFNNVEESTVLSRVFPGLWKVNRRSDVEPAR